MSAGVLRRGLLCLVVLMGSSVARADEGYLRYLPSDTRLVFTVHPTALDEQARKNGQELLRQIMYTWVAPELGKNEKLPFSDISRVVMAAPFAGSFYGVIVMRGKIDRKLLEKQFRLAVRKSRGAMTVEKMGKPAIPVFRRQVDDRMWPALVPQMALVPPLVRRVVAPPDLYIAAPDDETLFISMSGRLQMDRALRARPVKTSLRISDELANLLRKQDTKDVAAFVMLDGSLHPAVQLVASEALKEAFEQFEHVTGRVCHGKEIEISATVTGKSTEAAAELVTKGELALKTVREGLPKLVPNKPQRTILEGMLKGVRITRKENITTLTAKLAEADARKLLVVPQKKER
jgi:hypothetical protein